MVMLAENPTKDAARSHFVERAKFICELAKRLHEYGTSAPRLETAIAAAANTIGVRCQIWSNPTGILLSFVDGKKDENELAEITQVIRLEPGDINLSRLAKADAIAEQVAGNQLSLAEGLDRLRALQHLRPPPRAKTVVAYGIAAATVTILLQAGWWDVGLASVLGMIVGALALAAHRQTTLLPGLEAIAALLVAFLATGFGHAFAPGDLEAVLIASLITLLPVLL